MSTDTQTPTTGKTTAILIGALIVGVLVIALAKEFGGLDSDIAKRAIGIIFGVILMGVGNTLPKIVLPLSARQVDPAKTSAVDRFAGRVFVLAGMIYIGIWVFAPVELRMVTSSLVGLGAFGLVIVNWVIKMKGEFSLKTKADYRRLSMFGILHALLWVFAIFLVDSIWGDAAAKWMALGFVLLNGMVASLFFTKPPKGE